MSSKTKVEKYVQKRKKCPQKQNRWSKKDKISLEIEIQKEKNLSSDLLGKIDKIEKMMLEYDFGGNIACNCKFTGFTGVWVYIF